MNRKLKTAAATTLTILLAAAANTAVAADDEHAAHHPATDTAASSAADAHADAMANMKKMQEQMAAIRASKDPQQRAKLMDEHLQTMQSTMQMMQQDKGCSMMDKERMEKGGMGDMMKSGGESGGHMNMMQMMMEQMMQHQKAMQSPGK